LVRAGSNEFRHHRARARTQLETVGGKAELVEDTLRRGTRPTTGMSSGMRASMRPGAHDGRFAHRREEFPYVRALVASLVQSITVRFSSR